MFLTFRTSLLAIAALAVVRAEVCFDDGFRSIETQEQFDSAVKDQNCTSIRGLIGIATNYSGALVLNVVTRVELISIGGVNYESPNITSIEMPDVDKADAIFIDDGPPGLSVLAPKLKYISRLFVTGDDVELSFPSLGSVEDITLGGNIVKYDFEQLTNINGRLRICSNKNCTLDPGQPLDINFPSLEAVNIISLNGSYSGVSMPRLGSVGYDPYNFDSYLIRPGLTIESVGEPLGLNFPRLNSANKLLNFTGNFESISLPALNNSRFIAIQSYLPLDVNLTALVNVTTITLRGNISSAVFPELQRADSIIINTTSTGPLDCSSFDSATANAKANPIENGLRKGPFTCTRESLSTRVKSEIGLSVSIVFTAALAAIL